jgi:hypothetical protein
MDSTETRLDGFCEVRLMQDPPLLRKVVQNTELKRDIQRAGNVGEQAVLHT